MAGIQSKEKVNAMNSLTSTIESGSGGKRAGPHGNGRPMDDVHSILESTLNSLNTDVNDWFTANSNKSSSPDVPNSITASSALSVANPRPSRLGLGATPAQTRALLSAEERHLRERILGASSTARKRRGEFDHEAYLVKSLSKKARTTHSDVSVRKGHVSSEHYEEPDSDEESSKTRAVVLTTALAESETTAAPEPSPPARLARVSSVTSKARPPADMLSAYLGGKSKKRRQKQSTAASATLPTHPAIHPALLRSQHETDP